MPSLGQVIEELGTPSFIEFSDIYINNANSQQLFYIMVIYYLKYKVSFTIVYLPDSLIKPQDKVFSIDFSSLDPSYEGQKWAGFKSITRYIDGVYITHLSP